MALVLIFFSATGPGGRIHLVPWEEMHRRLAAWRAGGGPASIALEELAGSPAITQGRGAALDYLAAVDVEFLGVRPQAQRLPGEAHKKV